MQIKGVEVDFDFLDADDAKRFEDESKRVVENCEKVEKKELQYSEAIREECNIIEEFFDNVFGKGISEKMFKGKKHLGEHIKAFKDIVALKKENEKQLDIVYDRYKPNRAQRRANAKKGTKK